MRKLLWVLLALAVAASAGLAGGPPDRRGGAPGGQPDRGRWEQFRADFGAARTRGNAFDALRRYFDLTPEQAAAVAKLDEQRQADEREAISALTKELDKKYAALVVEALPAEQKAVYEKVIAVLTERDEAIEAAQKEFRAIFDKARADQGVTGRRMPFGALPNDKTDILRQCISLTDQQRTAMDTAQRDGWGAMRDKMREIPRPDWRDAEARQKYTEATRKVRQQIDAQTAEAVLLVLNEEQKKVYQTVLTGMETCEKKVAEAEDACEKKLAELVGPEKAKAMRAGWWQLGPLVVPGGPRPEPKGQEPPKATEF